MIITPRHQLQSRGAINNVSRDAIEAFFKKTFAGIELPDFDLAFRKARMVLGRAKDPNLRAVLIDDRPAVLFSREDLTAGLVGYPSYACYGYDPESAYAIMRNIVLYAATRQPQTAPATQP